MGKGPYGRTLRVVSEGAASRAGRDRGGPSILVGEMPDCAWPGL